MPQFQSSTPWIATPSSIFTIPLAQASQTITSMKIFSRIQIFVTLKLGLSMLSPSTKFLYFVFFYCTFSTPTRNDGGIVLNFLSNCGSARCSIHGTPHCFYFICTLIFMIFFIFYFSCFYFYRIQKKRFSYLQSTFFNVQSYALTNDPLKARNSWM